MERISLAVRLFFAVLFGSVKAQAVRGWLAGTAAPAAPVDQPQSPAAVRGSAADTARPRRNDAITLLATLQREARFVDLVLEPLQEYSDQQVGAAARDVLRDCRQVLARIFDVQPICDAAESALVQTPESLQDGRWRVTGRVQGEPPFRGRLAHHGWQAQRCDLPHWSGTDEAIRVIAPAEIEC